MHTEIPASITIDDHGDRYYWPAYKIANLTNWRVAQTVNPHVMMPQSVIMEAIEAHREWDQEKVNSLLSKYY